MKENWEYTLLENLFSFVIGGDWGKDLNEDNPNFIEAYCIRGSEIKDWDKNKGKTASLRKIAFNSIEKRKLQYGDILLEISGGGPDQPVGRTVFIDNDVFHFEPQTPKVCTNFLRLVRLIDTVDKKFINYYLTHFYKSGEVVNYQGGSNNLRNLKFTEYSKIEVPLPPLPEQKRIVAKLDTLFAHLDQLKARLQNIPTLLKQFRQAVLTQAVTGKLTGEWRNGKKLSEVLIKKVRKEGKILITDRVSEYELVELPKYWNWKIVSEVADVKGGKRLPKGEALVLENTGLPYIKAGDLKEGTVLIDQLEYLLPKTQEKIKRYIVSKGDVYITNVGACIGDAGIIPDEMDNANLTENALKLCNHEGVYNYYLSFWLRSPIAQGFIQKTILSGAQGKLALGRVESFPIPLPPIEEQKEIVRRVESLFAVADRIEASYETLQEKIDHLPQAILSKAFRGELVKQEEMQLMAAEARALYQKVRELN